MLRRGLHGAKNWVLELDENGEHRSYWSKGFRLAVVLLPGWIILSAISGGPQRSGQDVGVVQALFVAVLTTVVGLALFSARERKLGREEPWADLPSFITESDDLSAERSEAPGQEEPVDASGNTQVSGLAMSEGGPSVGNIPGTQGDFPQINPMVVRDDAQQATFDERSTRVIPESESLTEVMQTPMQQAITQGANQEEVDRTFATTPAVSPEAPTEVMQTATSGPYFPQVSTDATAMQGGQEKAILDWANLDTSDSAESDVSQLDGLPTLPLRPVVQEALQAPPAEPTTSQVNLVKDPLPQPLQTALQVQYATSGPYRVVDNPIADDWWLTKPDAPEEVAADTPTEPSDSGVPESPVAPEPEPAPTPAEPKEGTAQDGPLPPVVMLHLAAQANPGAFDPGTAESARIKAMNWVHEEVGANRLTRAEAARMFGVDKSTVSRWLAKDPWADEGDH